jgi:hypothetical protein
MQVSENPASSTTQQNELQAQNAQKQEENQASSLIHCRAEFAYFVQNELPPLPPALTEEVKTLERTDVRMQDSNIRALSWGRISG